MPKPLRAINARLAPLLQGLCGPDDTVAVPGDWVADAGRFERVEPWGVEPHVLGWLRLISVRDEALRALPGPAGVRFVNGRRWQFEEEKRLDVASKDQRLIEPRRHPSDFTYLWFDKWMELGAGMGRATRSGRCVVKTEFGGSGRGVRVVDDKNFEAIHAWGDRLLDREQPLFVEPFDDADAELSAHLTVTDDGVMFDGLCSLRSTPKGQFESVEPLFDPPPALLDVRPVWEAVAERARADGYRGPLGIDAAVKDGVVVRPIRDVNARWTMGRIALVTGREVRNP
ncbi:hypothetical protein [Alienimonas sp. DA493]|uniref:hypothetical protein n=1 Tax=Alienimonas sp. DA493 TaxID=3373605 RepID=UPI003754E789